MADLDKVWCVFDCMVFLQAAVSRRGSAFALLAYVEADRVELLVNPEILAEVRDLLFRPAVRKKFPSLSQATVEAFIERLSSLATLMRDVRQVFHLIRDPDDESYVNVALAGDARFLVTWDRDLLDLVDTTSELGVHLRSFNPLLTIVAPATILRMLKLRQYKRSRRTDAIWTDKPARFAESSHPRKRPNDASARH